MYICGLVFDYSCELRVASCELRVTDNRQPRTENRKWGRPVLTAGGTKR